ncbi:MAG: 1-deoxy-D-xylulose-5-phosphate synthase [Treponema sp.]
MTASLLEQIKSPADLQALSKKELNVLAGQLRRIILETVGANGGHLASNLGVIELTIALHRVFSSPHDAIIWDVGHQSYPHKLLTGRYADFSTLRMKDGLSGFPKREESEHDIFNTGHSSTSISAAEGIIIGRRLQQQTGKVIAVIGDGALTGGMAFEALLNITPATKGLVVILNDNKMSISQNTHAMSEYLSKLTMRRSYQRFKYLFDTSIEKIPVIGSHILLLIRRLKRGAKGVFYKNNLFVDLGFEYVGPLNGHNEAELEKVFRNVKQIETPVLVHIQTKKGRGYSFAEHDPSTFHGIGPFRLTDGKIEKGTSVSFTEAFSQSIVQAASCNSKITAITAAMAQGTGLSRFQSLYPSRFFDVGIAEQHAVTFAAGLAAAGLRPVVAMYSTFLQRAIDQIIHDTALQNLPVVFAVDRAGAVPYDGETHQGLYDISLLRSIPNISILCPASAADMNYMFQWAITQPSPVVIRYPKTACPAEVPAFETAIERGKGVMALKTNRSTLLFICTGGIYAETLEAANILLRESIYADIYTLRFIKPIDETFFLHTIAQYQTIVFVEDGSFIGSVSQSLELLIRKTYPDMSIAVKAFPDTVFLQGSRMDILREAGLTSPQLAQTAAALHSQHRS